jgi:hypothetical protein
MLRHMTGSDARPSRPHVPLGALWFGLFGAAAAWSIQELVSFALVSHSCYPDWQPRTLPIHAGTWTIALLIGIGMLVLGASAALRAWAAWRRTEQPDATPIGHRLKVGEEREHFMAAGGMVVSGLVLFTIVLNLLSVFLVPPCG